MGRCIADDDAPPIFVLNKNDASVNIDEMPAHLFQNLLFYFNEVKTEKRPCQFTMLLSKRLYATS